MKRISFIIICFVLYLQFSAIVLLNVDGDGYSDGEDDDGLNNEEDDLVLEETIESSEEQIQTTTESDIWIDPDVTNPDQHFGLTTADLVESKIDFITETSQTLNESDQEELFTEDEGTDVDDEHDEWDELEDDQQSSSEQLDIVDQMRMLREPHAQIPIELNSNNLNQTLEKLVIAWNILDTHYLASKKTWEKLLGLVTGLDVDVSPECFSSYFLGVSGFRAYKPWAYRFLDVRGRFPDSGTLHGSFASFGEWDECQHLQSPQSSSGLVVKGQYCMLEVKAPYPMTNPDESIPVEHLISKQHPVLKVFHKYLRAFQLEKLITPAKIVELLNMDNGTIFRAGLCIPTMCNAAEIETLLNNLTYPIFQMPLQVGPKCHKLNQAQTFDRSQLIAWLIVLILATLVIISSIVEWYNLAFEQTLAKDHCRLDSDMLAKTDQPRTNSSLFWYSFSALTNTRSLLAKPDNFSALDTVKFATVAFIHLQHYYNYLSTVGVITLKRIFTTYPLVSLYQDRYAWFRTSLPFEIIVITGAMMTAFTVRKQLNNSATNFFHIGLYLIKLWAKCSITYLASVGLMWIVPTLSAGPVWQHGTTKWLDACHNPNLVLYGTLFVSNYNSQLQPSFPLLYQTLLPYCNPPTWFLSVLVQLHLFGSVVIYLTFKLPKCWRLLVLATLAILSVAVNLIPFLAFHVKPDLHYLEFETLRETIQSHIWYRHGTTSYVHCFVLGLVGGYLLVEMQSVLRYEIETVLAIVAVGVIQLQITWNNTFWRVDKPPSLVSSLLWYSGVRFVGSLGIVYILFRIASNRANFIQRLLEWRPLVVISRLSYSYFMTHIVIVFYRIFSTKEVHSMDDTRMLQDFFIDLLATLTLAYIFYCLVEGPVTNLFHLLQGKVLHDIEHYGAKFSTSIITRKHSTNKILQDIELKDIEPMATNEQKNMDRIL